ncbi:glycosyltransferase [Oceanibium sediminis]|uniref:glycosyltransferase n=1 Tax=Oceanibium sediminis TaxID=2026339 RepID=UPI000DD4AC04|nr:glycosyltransferase [Oceanibium sediminis]
MKVALVHYWLTGMRGGEKVLEALCELYPDADIYTLVCDPARISETLRRHRIHTSFLQKLPFALKAYKSLLPLMPYALEQFDLSNYDLVISSEAGPAKGVIVRPDAVHICYCHSPLRYIWDKYHEYRDNAGFLSRMAMPVLAPPLRVWDVTTAARVDHFVANSAWVGKRIEKYFRRPSTVIHPPVETGDFVPAPAHELGDAYLFASQLVGYKRADMAVRVFNDLGKPLVVIGEGEQMAELRKIAGPTVTLLGRQPFEVLRKHFQTCRALVFPGEEDFGIVPVEVMSCGRPVIAFGRGGAAETVIDGETGVLFDEQTDAALKQAIHRFERIEDSFSPSRIRARALGFDRSVFLEKMRRFIDDALEKDVIPLDPKARLAAIEAAAAQGRAGGYPA